MELALAVGEGWPLLWTTIRQGERDRAQAGQQEKEVREQVKKISEGEMLQAEATASTVVLR